MSSTSEVRRPSFAVATALLVIVSIAVARLPESFVEQLRRNRPFDMSGSGWLYRLLAGVAIAQAFYVGFVALRTEKVGEARSKDQKLAHMTRSETVRSVARNAAAIALLTLVYGLSALALTGERGGYWLFAFVTLLQLAWYYRQVGQIAAWIEFQPEFGADVSVEQAQDTGEDHVPPLARGVTTERDDT